MISGSSILSALLIYTGVVFLIAVLHLWNAFLGNGGLAVLSLACILIVVRLFVPLEISQALVIRAEDILGAGQLYLRDNPVTLQGIVAVWLTGAAIVVSHDVFVLHMARQEYRNYVLEEDERVQQIAEKVGVSCPVRVTASVKSPFVTGVWKPVIYFPAMPLTDREIELSLRHEQQHVKSHDAMTKLLFGLLSSFMWWTIWFRGVVDAILEMRCDAKVTEHMSEKEIKEYLRMLQEMVRRAAGGKRTPALALDEFSAAGKGDKAIKRRFKVMNAHKASLSKVVSIAGSCALLILFLASYFIIFVPMGEPQAEILKDDTDNYYHENYDDREIGNELRSAFILRAPDGRYQLFINYTFSKCLSDDELVLEKYQNLHVFEGDIQK